MKTPSTKHIHKSDYEHIYEPSEDTFLLLDTLEDEQDFLTQLRPCLVLEIGSGAGLAITHLSKLLGPQIVCHSTDINPVACLKTMETGVINGVTIDAINTKFANGTRIKYDVVLFNPPYVVTESISKGNGIEASWAGGIDGREVIDEFLALADNILDPNGILYLVCINENKPDNIIEIMIKRGWKGVKLNYRVCGWEGLHVLKFDRIK